MAATVEGLRNILFNVKPPKELITRTTEMVIVSPRILDILKTPNRESATKFFYEYLDEMVIHVIFFSWSWAVV